MLTYGPAAAAPASPVVRIPGYRIDRISDAVPSGSIVQMAFKQGDGAHLFVTQLPGRVVRYDYDAVAGALSNATIVASGLGNEVLGLAFHGDDLYVSMDLGGSATVRPGDGRLARLSDLDPNGVYQRRHDFVHSIPKGNHDVNQVEIVGNTLYVGIGAVGRTGDPNQENVYTMTIAWIADLTQVNFSGPVGPDFKGPVNHLADESAWVDTTARDGLLRYYASGFRNPFGIAVDAGGHLWVSENGNSDSGFLSFDYLYKDVPLGGQGSFPPPSFGFGPPLITGTPIEPLTNLGQNPAPTGLGFVPAGPDAGAVILAQAGATNQALFPVGKDVLIVDPNTGAFQILVDDLDLPTDVLSDPFGRLLISDFADGSIWLLRPPLQPAGRVPDGHTLPGVPVTADHAPGGRITLSWSPSCSSGDTDYEIYEGALGVYYDHRPVLCTTGGATSATLEPAAVSTYYLVVPRNAVREGSYGRKSDGIERPAGSPACLAQETSFICR